VQIIKTLAESFFFGVGSGSDIFTALSLPLKVGLITGGFQLLLIYRLAFRVAASLQRIFRLTSADLILGII
jgi:hypothetical protein